MTTNERFEAKHFFFKKQVTQKLPIDISYQQVSILFSSIHNLQYNRLENKGLDIA